MEVAHLVERVTGQRLVCEQTLHNWVQGKAAAIEQGLCAQVAAAQTLPFPALAASVDLYDPEAAEVLVLVDGIGVKAQKPTRDKPGAPPAQKTVKRHDTDVMLLQGRDGSFRYLCEGLSQTVSLPALASAYLKEQWSGQQDELPLVAITDGAAHIACLLQVLFGSSVRIILDWYHLAKRVYEHLSMVAHSSEERKVLEDQVLHFLWHGQVEEAVCFVSGVSARNAKALAGLVGYLQKHASQIINYARRSLSGKSIGSGRIEKAVDQVVGLRQKKKGMSWSAAGSRALALLKAVELNGEWEQLWATAPAAA